MKFRKFGNTGLSVSVLGFGAMRLPSGSGRATLGKRVATPEAVKLIRHAIDRGINYIDTAYNYHGGNSEVVTGKALMDGYREKVILATKSPVWKIKEPEEFDTILDDQLKKLQTDHIDCYLLHSLTKATWENVVLKLGILDRAEAAKRAGKIKHIGFSFHDDYDTFVKIVDGYDKWEFCQIQYNYMGVEYQAGVEGLKYAASKGLGVVIMEPLLGGTLSNPPKDVLEVFEKRGVNRSATDWALQWLWDQPGISIVLSGMSNMEQVEENIASAENSGIGILEGNDHATIALVREKYLGRKAIPCTKCGYCMPCPHKVDIPGNFDLYNDGAIYGDYTESRGAYEYFFDSAMRANKCKACKACEIKCPQHICISEWMPKVHTMLASK